MKVICSILLLAFIFMQSHDISEAEYHIPEAFRNDYLRNARKMLTIESPATKSIKNVAAKMKKATEEFLGKKFKMFEAISYAYNLRGLVFIKVKVGKDECVHLRVYTPPYTGKGPSFVKAVDKKTEEDFVMYF